MSTLKEHAASGTIQTPDSLGFRAPQIRAVSQWIPGKPPQPLTDALSQSHDGCVWVDVEVPHAAVATEEAKQRSLESLLSALAPYCDGAIDAAMAEDLLNVRDRREGERYREGKIRSVSSFRVEARRLTRTEDGRTIGIGGRLVFQPVEFLCGPNWLVVCWHARRLYIGAEEIDADEPESHQEVLNAVAQRWSSGTGHSAADLGVQILHDLALTYAPAYREIASWLEEWELRLYLENELDRETLQDLWGAMTLLREWVSPLNRPGLRTDIDKAWFCGATDHSEIQRVDDRLDRALDGLRNLATTLRASFNLLHVQIAEEHRERREQLQRRLELAAAAFLVPTLIVGFYGANTKVPGEQTWWGFWIMVVALVLFSVVAVSTLWFSHRRAAIEAEHRISERRKARNRLLRESDEETPAR
jgi:hypothetical protein